MFQNTIFSFILSYVVIVIYKNNLTRNDTINRSLVKFYNQKNVMRRGIDRKKKKIKYDRYSSHKKLLQVVVKKKKIVILV